MSVEASHASLLADLGKPLKEESYNPKAWDSCEFYMQLASPETVPYEHLPHEIDVDEKWHELTWELVEKTRASGREYSVALSCIDKDGPLLSLPFDGDLFFQDRWGATDKPLFVSPIATGSETKAEVCSIPSAIEWQGRIVAIRRVGLLHTHPHGLPFSDGDMGWLTLPDTETRFITAATEHDTYLLMRTRPEPSDAIEYLRQQQGRYSWRERLGLQIHPGYTTLQRNRRLAQICRFGLYHGRAGSPFIRLA